MTTLSLTSDAQAITDIYNHYVTQTVVTFEEKPIVRSWNAGSPADIPYENLIEAGYKPEEIDGTWTPYRPVGCSACNNGYKGRVGIYQVMPISEDMQRIILADGSALEIAKQAKEEGVRSLRESGLHKVKLGLTSLEEVLAVTNE